MRVRHLIRMVDANQSIIAEFIAIVMSSVLFIAMEPHKLVLSIGQVLSRIIFDTAVAGL